MNPLVFSLIVATLMGASETVNIRAVVVHAYDSGNKEKEFDKGCEEVRDVLKDLQFDTYRLVKAVTISASFGKETSTRVHPRYTLHVKPISRDTHGRTKVFVRISEAPKTIRGKPRNVLTTTANAAPRKKFILGGITLDRGKGIVVLSVLN